MFCFVLLLFFSKEYYLFSKHTFEKYKKRGYNIRTHVVSDLLTLKNLIGKSYWMNQEQLYCKMNGAISFKEKEVFYSLIIYFITSLLTNLFNISLILRFLLIMSFFLLGYKSY